jgi:hypothetical protein
VDLLGVRAAVSVEEGRVQRRTLEETTHRAGTIDYVSLLTQEVTQVLHLLRDLLNRIAALARVQQTLFLGCIA